MEEYDVRNRLGPAAGMASHCGTMRPSARVSLALSASALLLAACADDGNAVKKPSDCPFVMVVLDAGTDAFATVGEYATDSRCLPFCARQYPVCQLASPTEVKCLPGCK
jgi:hypothetical protein